MDRVQLRNILIKMMLGCLIVAASVAVIAVLIGSFDEITGRALSTIFAALVHIFIVFFLMSIVISTDERTKRSSDIVLNISIGLVVFSFFTSVFGIWQLLTGETVTRLDALYVVILFAMIHAKTLFDVQAFYAKVKPYVYANYVLIGIVSVLVTGVIFLPDIANLLSGFYGRLLGASAIVDVTLTIVVAVMHRLHVQSHPELSIVDPQSPTNQVPGRGSRGVRLVLTVFVFMFVVLPLFFWLLAAAVTGL